jgi:hypothetical protein
MHVQPQAASMGVNGGALRRSCRCAGLLIALLALAGCRPEGPASPVTLVNDTLDAVRITQVLDGVEGPSRAILDKDNDDIEAGGQTWLHFDIDAGRCTAGDIVARTLDGREVARLLPPICSGERMALSWAVDSALARALPGTIDDVPTQRYTLTGSTAQAGKDCAPCRVFSIKEIDQIAAALALTPEELTFGLVGWTSKPLNETVVIRAIKTAPTTPDLLTMWVGIDQAKQPKTTVTSATIGAKEVTVLRDPTRAEWFATAYAYLSGDVLFLVFYSTTDSGPMADAGPPKVLESVLQALP